MRHFIFTTASVLLAFGALAPVARAAPGGVALDRCVGANTTAQSLRREGKFGAARAELATCIDASCPTLVRDDCTQRLDELDRAQPTIVFDAKDDDGHDVSEVAVEIDGRPFAPRLGGTALPVDPGEHTFTFEMQGRPSKVTRKLVLREFEKGRRESILFGSPALPVAAKGVALAPTRVEATPLGAQRVASIVALGLGVVGIGTGVAFAVQAKAKANDADAYCPATKCTNDAALEMNRDARAAADRATVAFAVGAAAVAGGVVLWLTSKPSPSSPTAEVALVGNTLRLRGTW
jgi:hypothetical protein